MVCVVGEGGSSWRHPRCRACRTCSPPPSPSSSPQELLEPHGYRHLVRIGVDEVFRRHPPCDGGRGREREREPRSRSYRHRRSQ